MTDESPGTNSSDESLPVGESKESPLEGAGDFSSGEGLVAVAGIVIIAVWLIFDILTTEYFVENVTLLLAASAVVAPRVNRTSVEKVRPLPIIMKVLGYGLGIVGLITVVEDIRYELLDEVWAVIGGLITYAAAGMAFIGAQQIKI